MDKIRTFIAIDLNEETKKHINEFISKYREFFPDIKWVKIENIHLTLKFLGNIFTKDYDKLYRGLEVALKDSEKIHIIVKSAGVFPSQKNARVLWLGVYGESEKFCKLHSKVESELQREGFQPEGRAFSPHITVARFKTRVNQGKLAEILTNSNDLLFGEFDVTSLRVYRSDLSPSGPKYSLLKEIKFGKIGL